MLYDTKTNIRVVCRMARHGRKNNGNPKDIVKLEQLENVLQENDFDITITVSTANLKWLVDKAGRWVRRELDETVSQMQKEKR
ncbi:hypothetical protein J4G37_33150 [Microvirga sp. 3-52]|nr:hypothetical protein [Microvirga sp. 3-52]